MLQLFKSRRGILLWWSNFKKSCLMSLHTQCTERIYFPGNFIFEQILSVTEMCTVQQYYVYYKTPNNCFSFLTFVSYTSLWVNRFVTWVWGMWTVYTSVFACLYAVKSPEVCKCSGFQSRVDDISFLLGINAMSVGVCSSHFEKTNCLIFKGLWPFNSWSWDHYTKLKHWELKTQ